MPLKRRSLERFAVLVVIVATHVLFLEILFRNGRQHLRLSAADGERGELFFFDLPASREGAAAAIRPSVVRRGGSGLLMSAAPSRCLTKGRRRGRSTGMAMPNGSRRKASINRWSPSHAPSVSSRSRPTANGPSAKRATSGNPKRGKPASPARYPTCASASAASSSRHSSAARSASCPDRVEPRSMRSGIRTGRATRCRTSTNRPEPIALVS